MTVKGWVLLLGTTTWTRSLDVVSSGAPTHHLLLWLSLIKWLHLNRILKLILPNGLKIVMSILISISLGLRRIKTCASAPANHQYHILLLYGSNLSLIHCGPCRYRILARVSLHDCTRRSLQRWLFICCLPFWACVLSTYPRRNTWIALINIWKERSIHLYGRWTLLCNLVVVSYLRLSSTSFDNLF